MMDDVDIMRVRVSSFCHGKDNGPFHLKLDPRPIQGVSQVSHVDEASNFTLVSGEIVSSRR